MWLVAWLATAPGEALLQIDLGGLQAQALAAELLLVAPYAQHWLSLTRKQRHAVSAAAPQLRGTGTARAREASRAMAGTWQGHSPPPCEHSPCSLTDQRSQPRLQQTSPAAAGGWGPPELTEQARQQQGRQARHRTAEAAQPAWQRHGSHAVATMAGTAAQATRWQQASSGAALIQGGGAESPPSRALSSCTGAARQHRKRPAAGDWEPGTIHRLQSLRAAAWSAQAGLAAAAPGRQELLSPPAARARPQVCQAVSIWNCLSSAHHPQTGMRLTVFEEAGQRGSACLLVALLSCRQVAVRTACTWDSLRMQRAACYVQHAMHVALLLGGHGAGPLLQPRRHPLQLSPSREEWSSSLLPGQEGRKGYEQLGSMLPHRPAMQHGPAAARQSAVLLPQGVPAGKQPEEWLGAAQQPAGLQCHRLATGQPQEQWPSTATQPLRMTPLAAATGPQHEEWAAAARQPASLQSQRLASGQQQEWAAACLAPQAAAACSPPVQPTFVQRDAHGSFKASVWQRPASAQSGATMAQSDAHAHLAAAAWEHPASAQSGARAEDELGAVEALLLRFRALAAEAAGLAQHPGQPAQARRLQVQAALAAMRPQVQAAAGHLLQLNMST